MATHHQDLIPDFATLSLFYETDTASVLRESHKQEACQSRESRAKGEIEH